MKDIVIYGFGGFATGDVTWLIDEINEEAREWSIVGYLDDNAGNHGKEKNGYKVLGGAEWLDGGRDVHCVVAIGNGAAREKTVLRIKDKVKGFPSLVNPDVRISRHAVVGEGCVICAGCLISGNAEIRDFVIVNLGCTIGHDAVLQEYSIVAPGVNISGNVEIGKYADIGTGATVIQGVRIGDGSVIGASAAVIRDIPAHCTAVGVPAKTVKPVDTKANTV